MTEKKIYGHDILHAKMAVVGAVQEGLPREVIEQVIADKADEETRREMQKTLDKWLSQENREAGP